MNKDISILIVDDNELIRTIARRILEREGYQHFVEAGDGASAYGVLQSQKIDLIISDWNMLGMTGIELLKKVRANQKITQTPFIIVSVEGLDVSVNEAIKNGANDFISKPFRSNQLIDSVTRVMEQTV